MLANLSTIIQMCSQEIRDKLDCSLLSYALTTEQLNCCVACEHGYKSSGFKLCVNLEQYNLTFQVCPEYLNHTFTLHEKLHSTVL